MFRDSAELSSNAYRKASQTPVRAVSEAAVLPPLVIPQNGCPSMSERSARLLGRGALKAQAAKLLFTDPDLVKTAGRIFQCGWGTFGKAVTLKQDTATGSASFGGVKCCRNVWCCAECSARICAKRAEQVNDLLLWAHHNGFAVLMLTLTAAHNLRDALESLLTALKDAKQAFRQRRDWRDQVRPYFVGSVTATEVTYGQHGWHVHFHEIMILRQSVSDALANIEQLRDGWLTCLERFGLSGNHAAFQVQGAEAACSYVTKFGAAEELALSTMKKGRQGGRTPFQLLADSRDGDAQASALWLEYGRAFKGRNQLVWSKGLKDACGLNEADDDVDVANSATTAVVREWASGSERWREARRRRISIVLAAIEGSDLDAAEYGPTDQQRWEAGRDVGIKMETKKPGGGRRRSPEVGAKDAEAGRPSVRSGPGDRRRGRANSSDAADYRI